MAGAGALGDVALEGGGDVAVLLADQEPRGYLAPERLLARLFGERLLRRGSLRRGHSRGLRRGRVGAEVLTETLACDVQVGGAVAARAGRIASPSMLLGNMSASWKQCSPAPGESVGVEPDDFAGVGGDVGDHRAAVGVGGEHNGPVD